MIRKPEKLWLPGIFLLLLGVGNLAVGYYKGIQYDYILEDLSDLSALQEKVRSSPLMRFELSKRALEDDIDQESFARMRRELYSLVELCGQAMICFSLLLLGAGTVVYLRRRRILHHRYERIQEHRTL